MKRIVATSLFSVCLIMLASICHGQIINIDADSYADGADISNAFEGATLSAYGSWYDDSLDGKVYARTAISSNYTTTGSNVFGSSVPGIDSNGFSLDEVWAGDNILLGSEYFLRVEFDHPADYVSIDVIANSGVFGEAGLMWAYNSAGNRIYTDMSPYMTAGQSYTCMVGNTDSVYDIAYIIVSGYDGYNVHLDNLVAEVPEPATLALLGLGGLLLRKRKQA